MIYNLPRQSTKYSETWVIKSDPNDIDPTETINVNIRFVANKIEFSKIDIRGNLMPRPGIYYDTTHVCNDNSTWVNDAYRTVTFLEPPSGKLLTWLQANAVKQ